MVQTDDYLKESSQNYVMEVVKYLNHISACAGICFWLNFFEIQPYDTFQYLNFLWMISWITDFGRSSSISWSLCHQLSWSKALTWTTLLSVGNDHVHPIQALSCQFTHVSVNALPQTCFQLIIYSSFTVTILWWIYIWLLPLACKNLITPYISVCPPFYYSSHHFCHVTYSCIQY